MRREKREHRDKEAEMLQGEEGGGREGPKEEETQWPGKQEGVNQRRKK